MTMRMEEKINVWDDLHNHIYNLAQSVSRITIYTWYKQAPSCSMAGC